jgi:CO/xanthine dehydrogenase Mo-binding subunit
LEDPPLLTGRGPFVGDIGFPHQLHMRIVRSPYANAVLRSVNVTMALAAPGIVAVWTAAEIAGLPPIDFRDPAAETLRPYRQPLLARERLRYVGEPIAAVFATDPYLADDAAELVSVEADMLEPIRLKNNRSQGRARPSQKAPYKSRANLKTTSNSVPLARPCSRRLAPRTAGMSGRYHNSKPISPE